MRVISVIFISVLAGVFCGCTPTVSIRALYTDDELKHPIVEPRIEGEWISPDLDKVGTDEETMFKWKIAPPSNSNYHVEFRPGKPDIEKGDQVYSYDVRLIGMGDKLFFDADFDAAVEGQVKTGSDDVPGLVGAHLVGRVWIHSDYLRVALLDPTWMKGNSPDSFRELRGEGVIITASTQELRDFLLRNSDNDEAMGLNLYLCHPGTDCVVRELDDQISMHPKEDALLKQGGQVFLARGNYERALELERRRLESKPEDSSVREDLAGALLFNKDFRAARGEFAAIQKSAEQKSASATTDSDRDRLEGVAADAAAGTVWSYFIEGDYAGAVTAFANYKGRRGFLTANPILLNYFSLRRLGKRAEAEAMLKEQSRKYKGPQADQLLLLDVQGRLVERGGESPEQPKGDALQRFDFYRAQRWIDAGDTEAARSNLQSALEVADAPKDGLPALAAKIELERLGPSPKK